METEQRDRAAPTVACRFCSAPLGRTVVDLGMSPLCESFLRADQLDTMEPFYPLHVRVCETCHLVQLPEYVAPENIFTEYAYFSSYSDAFVSHARDYAEMIVERLGLSGKSFVVELASNDGYLLQHFVARGVPVLGIDPARNVAEAAIARGVPTRVAFFGRETAAAVVSEHGHADLVVGNNVLSQVPDLDDFVAGIATLLAPGGVVTVEFPHLMRLLEGNLFDTIYHEHFSYFSLLTASRVFAAHGLDVFDLEEVWTHGGSLRLFAAHASAGHETSDRIREFAERERTFGLESGAPYEDFRKRVEETKRDLLEVLIAARRDGLRVAAYGAPGKGNTLLNYCGIRADLLEYTVDRNPHKHGLFLPGTHIPIFPPERLAETRPDLILVLPWNLRDEIVEQLAYTREWGARLVFALPALELVPAEC
ncbi:MAG: class I SAM-dependent methyltransferase [Actinobacteria bacterium]|nr:MAG: class I SAM-dependent methyltransferase [Actinomycetota bacterium]